jgi:drug/metabolite transporter (DMT)-like permease
MATRADYLKLHFIVFLWGFSAILGKLVTIPTMEMIFYRALLAAAGMAIVIYATGGMFQVSKVDLIRLLLIGSLVALHWVAFFGSARISNVSVSLVGFATNSLWAALLEPWFNKNKVKKFELLLGLVVLLGLYVIFSIDVGSHAGLALGILAGFTSALFSVFNSRMVRRVPAFTITFYEMFGIVVTLMVILPLYSLIPGVDLQLVPAPTDWIWIALLAGVCSIYAYSVAVELMKKVSVFMIQLTLNLEPVYGIVMAVIIFKQQERMDWNFYLGTIIILLAVGSYPFLKRKFDRPKELVV